MTVDYHPNRLKLGVYFDSAKMRREQYLNVSKSFWIEIFISSTQMMYTIMFK